jgi:hypothetical protein
VVEAQGLLRNPQDEECPLLEAVTRGLVKGQLNEQTKCVL